jgi:hypothetical protein
MYEAASSAIDTGDTMHIRVDDSLRGRAMKTLRLLERGSSDFATLN